MYMVRDVVLDFHLSELVRRFPGPELFTSCIFSRSVLSIYMEYLSRCCLQRIYLAP